MPKCVEVQFILIFAFKQFKNDMQNKEYLDSDNVKIAYINGIHLEEKKLFDRNICLQFLLRKDIIRSDNEIQFAKIGEWLEPQNEK